MAILTKIHTEILCLSCDRRALTKWKAYMVCTHIAGVWKFLRIGTGADPVKACFCIICPSCVGKAIINSEDNIEEIRAIFNSRPLRDAMNEIEQENDVVIIETYATVKAYLAKTRPLIQVGKKVQTSVHIPEWNNDSHLVDFAEN
jgi:hypothetical protein